LKDYSNISRKIDQVRALCDDQVPGRLESVVSDLAGTPGEAIFRDQAVEILADIIDHAGIIPDAYRSYRPIVRDGILHFISKLSMERLAGLVAHQMRLDEDADPGKRLVEIAKQVPTFHKLGQIIARNRHMDPRVRAWLVQLENGSYGTDATDLRRMIEGDLGDDLQRFRVRIDDEILAEASVGAVLPFTWTIPGSGRERSGVFKTLKPGIVFRLEEEMAALDSVGAYFEPRRHHYEFGEFRFQDLFGDVRDSLLEELNLEGEQANLLRAHRFYRKNGQVNIPMPAPFSTRYFTAMARVDGDKVTDALYWSEERKQAAEVIFRAVVCGPLFSDEESPVFHGDPHAGNIFSAPSTDGEALSVSLLDWSQSGRLEKQWRVSILKFIQGVIRDDDGEICRAISALSADAPEEQRDRRIETAVEKIKHLAEYRDAAMIKKIFIMLEQLTYHGIRFHKDLLLFRKTFFTLDGLLHDLDPEFNMDQAMMAYIRDLLIGELPRRIAALLVPIKDAPEKYRSLLSNKDLQLLLLCQAVEVVRKNIHVVREFMEKHSGLIVSLFCLPKILRSRTAKVLLGLYYLYRMRDAAAEA
jgi:ubiquinone biosynthesis protein